MGFVLAVFPLKYGFTILCVRKSIVVYLHAFVGVQQMHVNKQNPCTLEISYTLGTPKLHSKVQLELVVGETLPNGWVVAT